jgi:serine/threonine-protein kinase RsbW
MAQLHSVNTPAHISRPTPFIAWHHSMPSRIADIDLCVNTMMHFIKPFARKFNGGEEAEIAIETALREAVVNAAIHGNREDPHKFVYLTCRCSMDGEITISVQDEGCGFDTRALLDPTDRKNRLLPHGRGIYLMRALMDQVSFEDNGRLVCMRKTLAAKPEQAPFVQAAANSLHELRGIGKESAQQLEGTTQSQRCWRL